MAARKLGHGMVLLRSESELSKAKCCNAVFANCKNYGTALVRAGRKSISIKHVDSKDNLRDNAAMHDELVKFLYNVLENGGHVSNGRKRLDASSVPGFMIGCILNGC